MQTFNFRVWCLESSYYHRLESLCLIFSFIETFTCLSSSDEMPTPWRIYTHILQGLIHHFLFPSVYLVWLSLSLFFWPHCTTSRDLGSPNQAWNPCPLQWKHRVLTTGLPSKGSPLDAYFYNWFELIIYIWHSCWTWANQRKKVHRGVLHLSAKHKTFHTAGVSHVRWIEF